jgi:hypothetical protein
VAFVLFLHALVFGFFLVSSTCNGNICTACKLCKWHAINYKQILCLCNVQMACYLVAGVVLVYCAYDMPLNNRFCVVTL